MGFRTVDIGSDAEIHIRKGQLEISNKTGTILIPVEDIDRIMAHGANIRLSTMDLSILSRNKISLTTFDERYLPTAIVLPFEGHARQSKLMHAQVTTSEEKYERLWMSIVESKILNQSRVLSILGLEGAEEVAKYAESIDPSEIDFIEAQAAKRYFSFFHEGLNRRTDDPVNSRLNYGYAVMRSYIARCLVASGFHPTFGIHHNSQLNAFNLADDLVEPYRTMVDLVALKNIGSNTILSKKERRELSGILHNACVADGAKVKIMHVIEMMVESLKRIILCGSEERLILPTVLPVEFMEGVTE